MSSPTPDQTAETPVPTITGACLCKSIAYSLTGPPLARILCHCLNCKKSSGSAFMANSFYLRSQFDTSDPESRLRTYVDTDIDRSTASSESPAVTLNRCFCGNCGSPLFFTNSENKDLVIVTTGSMDNTEKEEWRPEHELYCARRVGWLEAVEGARKVDGLM